MESFILHADVPRPHLVVAIEAPMFKMQAGELYAELLERLDTESFIPHAVEPRPHLVVATEVLRHNPIFP